MTFVVITVSVLCILVLSNIFLWCNIICTDEQLVLKDNSQEPSNRSQKLFTYMDGVVIKHNVVKWFFPEEDVIKLVLKDGSILVLAARTEYSLFVQKEEI